MTAPLGQLQIPDEVLHQLYRNYCLARFPYDYPPGQEEQREQHVNYDARSYYRPGEDEDGNPTPGHVGSLAQLVEAAYRAGRDAAYDRDEWRVSYVRGDGHRDTFWLCAERTEAQRELKDAQGHGCTDPWLEHRRVGATEWEKVDV